MSPVKQHPNYLLFTIRALGLTLTSLALAPIYALVNLAIREPKNKHKFHYKMMGIWGKACSFISGYKITLNGCFPKNETVFVCANHIGYADIIALSKVMPIYFVSKEEVKSWPLIGPLACLVKTILISRKRDKALSDIKNSIKQRLDENGNVLVFLEGRATDGSEVMPFYSPLLQAPIEANRRIVPVSLNWTTNNPQIDLREDIAYWREGHNMIKHLMRHLGKNSKHVEINIGEPISIGDHNRKTLAQRAHQEVVNLRETRFCDSGEVAEKQCLHDHF